MSRVTIPCRIPHRSEKRGDFFSPEKFRNCQPFLPQDYTVAISQCGTAQRWRNALWLFQCMRQVPGASCQSFKNFQRMIFTDLVSLLGGSSHLYYVVNNQG